MKKSHKFRMSMILSLVLAAILLAISGYILLMGYLATKQINFTWTTNILLGIAGVLILFGNWCHGQAKEHTSLFD